MEMVKNGGVEHGTVIYTENQTKGRGQLNSVWEAEPGQNLTFSIIYRTDFIEIGHQFDLNIAVSIALQMSISKFVDQVSIKWPNDIYVIDKKVAGVLIENTLKGKYLNFSVVGIGINVNQEKFAYPSATSLCTSRKEKLKLEEVLKEVLEALDNSISNLKDGISIQHNKEFYTHHLFRKGIPSLFESDGIFEGVIIGVDEMGRLVVSFGGKVNYFNNKEIRFVI